MEREGREEGDVVIQMIGIGLTYFSSHQKRTLTSPHSN